MFAEVQNSDIRFDCRVIGQVAGADHRRKGLAGAFAAKVARDCLLHLAQCHRRAPDAEAGKAAEPARLSGRKASACRASMRLGGRSAETLA
jgi:hypothetical protein